MRLLITAGPTREPIDPVRFISNRSSGKMGYALAEAAVAARHEVMLISGPVQLATPDGVRIEKVGTASEMLEAVLGHLTWCEGLVMAAAVADWRPVCPNPVKLKKDRMASRLELEPTPDILREVLPLKGSRIFVGFAAETHDLLAEARRKLEQKGLDMIVANDVTRRDAGFEADTNQVTLLTPDGRVEALPLLGKRETAERIVARMVALRP